MLHSWKGGGGCLESALLEIIIFSVFDISPSCSGDPGPRGSVMVQDLGHLCLGYSIVGFCKRSTWFPCAMLWGHTFLLLSLYSFYMAFTLHLAAGAGVHMLANSIPPVLFGIQGVP